MTIKIDKVYIISLDKSSENIKHLIRKVKEVGLPNKASVEIVGINGWELSDNDLAEMNIKILEGWNLNKQDHGNLNYYHNRDITKGEIGCSLSHIKIWEDAYKNNYENIIIYEEDFKKNSKTNIDWNELDNTEFDLLYLGRSLQYGREFVWDEYYSETFCYPGMSYQSHAYILSRNGLDKIVNFFLPRFKSGIFPLDDFLASCYTGVYHDAVEKRFPECDKILNALAYNKERVYQNKTKPSLTEPLNCNIEKEMEEFHNECNNLRIKLDKIYEK